VLNILDAYTAAKNGESLAGWANPNGFHVGVGTDPHQQSVCVWPVGNPDNVTEFDVKQSPEEFAAAVDDHVKTLDSAKV